MSEQDERVAATVDRVTAKGFGFATTPEGERLFVPPPVIDRLALAPGDAITCTLRDEGKALRCVRAAERT